MIIDNRKADQPASQSAKKEKILQDDYNTKISPVKEEDYYIQVPISVHNEGIRALATLLCSSTEEHLGHRLQKQGELNAVFTVSQM